MDKDGAVKIIEAIVGAKTLIEKGWTADYWAKDSAGNKVHWLSEDAVKYDLSGAIYVSCKDLSVGEHNLLMFSIDKTMDEFFNGKTLIEYNDSSKNVIDIIVVLDKLMDIIKSELKNGH